MICHPVCPGDAFSPQQWPDKFTYPPRTLRLQCRGGEEPEFGEEGRMLRVPCLDAFGWWDLLRLYLGGTREVLYAHGTCAACPSGSEPRFLAAVATVNQILTAAGLEPLRCQQVTPEILMSQGQGDRETPGWSRRGLLSGTFLRSAEAIVAPILKAKQESDKPQEEQRSRVGLLQQLAQLAQTPHLSAYEMTLDSTHCYACHACFRLCPSGALRIEDGVAENSSIKRAGNGQAFYVLTPSLCVGCELCQDVCDVDAMRVAWNPSEHAEVRWTLFRHQCDICSLEYPSLAEHETVCWVCRTLEERKQQTENVTWLGLNESEGEW
jgi:formate hydrogenlyase subunit 6/NADH:ubiquinone oxidoreductase subunit I